MNSKLILIKAGGSILQDETLISSLCMDIKAIASAGHRVIVVHGGGKAINEALAVYGIKSEFIEGLRVTSSEAIKVIEMVLCGQVNQLLVRKLNQTGLSTISLSGAQNQMLFCDLYSQQHGYVGEVKSVNTTFLKNLSEGAIPVIATLGIDKEGHALNINADMAACHIANALDVDQLIYLTDQDGIYNKQGQLFAQLSKAHLQLLINQAVVSGGMLVKVKAIIASLKAGLDRILVLNGQQKRVLIDTVLYQKQLGTLCECTPS
ncbi:Acetylglutamate kinase [Legionella massiliensis]|uniref:Acetylglutamate kinase n=1 Tax=Legionella massiliensis TaxID=1034943 RepID=A0A078L312_9GAMM|nr:acetylglutamate kinase [Legionella massiliensis]CDZ78378.1 Acetylglutamate kinase [Legionella massiliensis]CEE14116.1 Acetylglutamate kinase [Legionella massiliensis]